MGCWRQRKGKENTDYFAKELKAGENAQGDAVIVDINMNGILDKEDIGYRASNFTDVDVNIGQSYTKVKGSLTHTGGFIRPLKPVRKMNALDIFKELTGKKSTNDMKNYSIEGKNMKSIFERKAFEPIKRYVDPNPATWTPRI